MKVIIILAAVAALLTGCATHDRQTIARVRAAGVSGRTVAKLEYHGSLTPDDVIELKRRGVSDIVPIRQFDYDGVDYVIQRDEITKLRKAGVRPAVTDAAIAASDRFVRARYAPPPRAYWGWGWGWGYDEWGWGAPSYYYDPWWFPRTSVSLGYAYGGHHRCR